MNERTTTTAARRTLPAIEDLEGRVLFSWSGVPPTVVTPDGAMAVSITGLGAAQGQGSVSSNEVDYYSFVAPATDTYLMAARTPVGNLDTVLGVFNAQGQRLAYNDDITSANTDSELRVTLTAGRRYYFGITNYTNTPGGSYTWHVQSQNAGRRGDANGDGRVDVQDAGILATWYGRSAGGAGASRGDFNEDGRVDVLDLSILSTNYGAG